MAINTLIIDDEKDSIDVLTSIINLYNLDLNIVGAGSSVDEAVKLITSTKPDLVFLDVMLGNELCFSIFEHLDTINFHVIFISASDQFVFKAFKYSAVDYLLKPIDFDELKAAIHRIETKRDRFFGSMENLQMLIANMNAPKPYKLSIPTSDGLEFIDINDILHIKADGNYSVLFFDNGEKIMATRSIGEFYEQLHDDVFCRVHNSYIVNLKYVYKLSRRGGLTVEMKSGDSIPIARNRKDIFMQKIKSYALMS